MMTREMEMNSIQVEKAKEMAERDLLPLDAEGRKIAEHKRFTFDIVDTPTDPLR